MNPSKLSKPVIAGIAIGGVVACTLVVLLILKLTGFFEPSGEPGKTETPEVKLSESCQKGIKLMPLSKEEDVKYLEKWIKDELPGIMEKEPAALEIILDALITNITSLLEKGKAHKTDPVALENILKYVDVYNEAFYIVHEKMCEVYGFEKGILETEKTSKEIIELYKNMDPKALLVGKKILNFLKIWKTIKLLNLKLTQKERLDDENFLNKVSMLLQYLDTNLGK